MRLFVKTAHGHEPAQPGRAVASRGARYKPELCTCALGIGIRLSVCRNSGESIKECEQARALDPQVKLRSSALNAYLYSGHYDKFLQSLPPDDSVAFVIFYRGMVHLYLRNSKTAAAYFDRAYELDPSLYTQIGKAFSYLINERRSEGLELLKATEARMK